jgi:sugar phosphate isomerase/epimerase
MITGLLLHSVSYSGTWGQPTLPLEAFVDHAADLGFDGVMLMAKRPHLSVLDYSDDACRRLHDRIERRGLRKVVIAGYTNLTAGFRHQDIPQVEYQIAHMVRLAEMASLLGGNLIRVFTGYESAEAPLGRQWQCVVDALAEASDRAAEYGVTIGVQNHHDLAVDSVSMRELITDVGRSNCAAMFDAWSPALHGEDPSVAGRLLAPVTVHTTVANYVKRERYRYTPGLVNYERLTPRVQAVPIDEGFIDYAAFLGAMEEAGFNGTVAYEMCSPLRGGPHQRNLDQYATRFLEFMHGKAGTARQRQEAARTGTGEGGC